MNDGRKSAIKEIAKKQSIIKEGTKKGQEFEQNKVLEKKAQGNGFEKRKVIVKSVAISDVEAKQRGKINTSPKIDEEKKIIKSKAKDIRKKTILGKEKKSGIVKQSETCGKDGNSKYGIKVDSSVKRNQAKNKNGIRIKRPTNVAVKQMKEAIKMKRIRQFIEAENSEEMIDISQRTGIQAMMAIMQSIAKLMLKAAASITLKLSVLLMPFFLFMSPVIFITVCIAGFGGSPTYQKSFDQNLPFGINGDLKYVSYRQGNYEKQYGETGWCGITSFTDMLASYGCTSPYRKGELINPCDAVRYADENGCAIIGSGDGVHYLNTNWYSKLCSEYGLEYSDVLKDSYSGEKLLEWVNEKLDDGWQVVVCFDAYAKYESGANITSDRHYIWLVCYADNNHESYACIDPAMGGADSTFLSEATAEGGYGDYIVNKSQIISKTGGTNYITGFAVRMPK